MGTVAWRCLRLSGAVTNGALPYASSTVNTRSSSGQSALCSAAAVASSSRCVWTNSSTRRANCAGLNSVSTTYSVRWRRPLPALPLLGGWNECDGAGFARPWGGALPLDDPQPYHTNRQQPTTNQQRGTAVEHTIRTRSNWVCPHHRDGSLQPGHERNWYSRTGDGQRL